MRIANTATAFPQYYYTQREVVDALRSYWDKGEECAHILERLHFRTGVEGRYYCRPLSEYQGLDTWGKMNDVWIEVAEQLGERAIDCVLRTSGGGRDQIGALFFVSVTGVSSPSIDARLVGKMKLNPSVKRTPIFGLGCVAGAAGIARAADYVRAFPKEIALLLSVELCSLTWQDDDQSIANLISTGLFADGAAAVVIAGAESKLAAPTTPSPKILATRSTFYRNTEYVMGWDVVDTGFKIVLSPDVPKVVLENILGDVEGFLADNNLSQADIASYIFHSGGPKVLEAMETALSLPPDALAPSWKSLREVGNLSAASVLAVLEDYLTIHPGTPGTYSILAAMGPAFCSELVLLKW